MHPAPSVYLISGKDSNNFLVDKNISATTSNTTIGEYLNNNISFYFHCVFLLCGGFHICIRYDKLAISHILLIIWRSILIMGTGAFIAGELAYLVTYNFTFRHALFVSAIVFQFAVIVPIILDIQNRLKLEITENQKNMMNPTLEVYHKFLMYGIFVGSLYILLIAIYGQYDFKMLQLIIEGFGYGCGTLLATWAILFVIWDALVTRCELEELLDMARKHEITSKIYLEAYRNRYTDSELKSSSICNGIAFCAYFNLFVSVVNILTEPHGESWQVTALFCFVFLSREASFLFFCFPFFVSVNTIANQVIDILSESIWTHPNGIDSSANICLLSIRKPFKISILGRIVTLSEVKMQLLGLLFVFFSSIIRVVELQRYSDS